MRREARRAAKATDLEEAKTGAEAAATPSSGPGPAQKSLDPAKFFSQPQKNARPASPAAETQPKGLDPKKFLKE